MAASGSILPNPKMYFVNNNGEPLGSGYLYTYRAADPTQKKFVFQDPGMTIPYADPIRIDANGTTGPIFWAADELYYIVVQDVDQNQIWSMNNYGPAIAGGGGGGGNVTTSIDIENLVQNNVFWRNSLTATGAATTVTPAPTFLTIAPGAHAGLSGDTTLTTTTGSPAPDICFMKNTATAGDTIGIGTFLPGFNELTGDATPVNYLHYESTAVVGETFKFVQFPITAGAQNISNQAVKGSIWVRWLSGASTLNIYWRQFFGSGSAATAEQRSAPLAIPLITTDTDWHNYPIVLPIPSVAGANLGQCGNDGLFLQIEYPLNQACSIDFTKPAIYLGNFAPTLDFRTIDQNESVINDFRTGDIRSSLNAFAPFGWVPMNDGTIGTATSGATARANRDTFPLYALLWNNVADAYAPVITGRGASAIADFEANKQLTLTKMLGRVLGEAGTGAGLTARALGEPFGAETHVLTIAEMPSHNHPTSSINSLVQPFQSGPNPGVMINGATLSPINVASQGNDVAHTIMQPTSFVNFFVKL